MMAIRFGSFTLAFGGLDAFWTGALARRFRTAPREWPALRPDVTLRLERRPEAAPACRLGDALEVARDGARVRVRCDLMTLAGDLGAASPEVQLTFHAPGWTDEALEHSFTVFVHKLLQLCGVVRLHGAAVTWNGRTHVLLGDKGAGKSTTALALGQAGAVVLAEDQIVIRQRATRMLVSGCDGNIRLTAETERALLDRPLEVAPLDFAGTPKKEVSLEGLVPVRPYDDQVAHRLYFPRVGRRFGVHAVGRREAALRVLDAIGPAHGFAGPADRWDLVRLVTAFVAPLDCFDVELSDDLARLDEFIAFART